MDSLDNGRPVSMCMQIIRRKKIQPKDRTLGNTNLLHKYKTFEHFFDSIQSIVLFEGHSESQTD